MCIHTFVYLHFIITSMNNIIIIINYKSDENCRGNNIDIGGFKKNSFSTLSAKQL